MRMFTQLVSAAALAVCIVDAGAQTLGPAFSGDSTGEAPATPAPSLPVKQYGSVLSENVGWQAFPAFPPEARLAVLVGEPAKPGPYVVRVKMPAGVRLMPYTHPEDRIYTVVSGVFYIGLGTTYDPDKLQAHAPGSVVVLPATRRTSTGRSLATT